MCVHISKDIWERNKARLQEMAEAGDRDEAVQFVRDLSMQSRGEERIAVSSWGASGMVDRLIASVQARSAHERERELVTA